VSAKLPAITRKRILVVDDEREDADLLARMLMDMGYAAEVALSGRKAIARLKDGFDLILLDVTMPFPDGLEVAREVRRIPACHDVPIIMMTALATRPVRLRAVEAGASDFIAKPVDPTELRVRVASLLRMKEAQDALKRHRAHLEATVQKRTAALIRALKDTATAQREAQHAHLDTVRRLAIAAEYRDRQTSIHIHRMSRYCGILARGMGLTAGDVDLITHASPLHDVGKIGVPDSILLKPGKLDESEWRVMRDHPVLGARILEGSASRLIQTGQVIAMTHHERWDGSGYPRGLAGESIPLVGRISAVADVFDALTSRRPYKPAFTNEKSVEILRAGSGSQFDPRVVTVFVERLEEIHEIQTTSSKSIRGSL
jgi:putative two-component system response regulator